MKKPKFTPAPHAAHPKCPKCGKSLYKRAAVGDPPVPASAPYAFCRNPKCERDAVHVNAAPVEDLSRPPSRRRPAKPARPNLGRAIEQIKTAAERADGPNDYDEAAVRAEPLVERIAKHGDPVSVGIVLALLNQASGGYGVSNRLIERMKLDKRFGLSKFS